MNVSEIQEICNMETFEGKCSADDIIFMTSAWYGRMKAGKCADPAYGFVGCKASPESGFWLDEIAFNVIAHYR